MPDAAAQWQRLGYTSKERCRAAFLCGYRDRVATALYRAKAEQHALPGWRLAGWSGRGGGGR